MNWISTDPRSHRTVGISLAVFIVGITVGWWLPFASKSNVRLPGAPYRSPTSKDEVYSSRLLSADRSESAMDFVARLHTALGIQGREKRDRAISRIADDLSAAQLQEAVQRLAGLYISDRHAVLAQLMARWGAIDPHAALEFVRQLEKRSDRRTALEAIINGWMETDPDAVEQWIAELPDGPEKTQALKPLLLAQGPVDPQRALSNLGNIDLGWDIDWLAHAIFDLWAKNNPEEAVRFIDGIPSSWLKTGAIRIVARQWAESDVAAAISWAQTLPDVLPFYGPSAGEVTCGADRTNALNALLETWLARDASAALNWLSELPDGLDRVALICRACDANKEAGQNPDVAMRLAALLPEGMHRQGAIDGFLESWATSSPLDEFAWATEQTDLDLQRTALGELVRVLAGGDLKSALDFASTLPDATKWIFPAQSFSDPAAVATWLMQQPNNEKYFPQMAAAWATKDPTGPLGWLQTLPIETKDSALAAIVERAVKDSDSSWVSSPIPLPSAAEFAAQIANPQARETALESLAKAWLKTSPDAAREWLDSAPISEMAKQTLLGSTPAR